MAEMPHEALAALVAAAPHAAFTSVMQNLRVLVGDEAAWWGVVAPCCLDYHLQHDAILLLALRCLPPRMLSWAAWSRVGVDATSRHDAASLVLCRANHLLSWVRAYDGDAGDAPSLLPSLSTVSLEEALRCHFRDMTSFLFVEESTGDKLADDVFGDLTPSYGFEHLQYVFIDAEHRLYVEVDPTTLCGVRAIPFGRVLPAAQAEPRATLAHSCSLDEALDALECSTQCIRDGCDGGDVTAMHMLCTSLRNALHADIASRSTRATDDIVCQAACDVVPTPHCASSPLIHLVIAMAWDVPAQGWCATYNARYTLAPQVSPPDAAATVLCGEACVNVVIQEAADMTTQSGAQYTASKTCAAQAFACCPPALFARNRGLREDGDADRTSVDETVAAVMCAIARHSDAVRRELASITNGCCCGGVSAPWLRCLYTSLRRRLPQSGMPFDHRRPSLATSALPTSPAP